MKIVFAFENPLPSREADAEVFTTTARHLAPLVDGAVLHVPVGRGTTAAAIEALVGLPVVPAAAPLKPAVLRHLACALTLPTRRCFREADLVYTRNLAVAIVAVLCRKPVAFDHYRPWPDQIPPLQPILHRLHRSAAFLVNICHSEYTRRRYLALGVAPTKLVRIRNGFDPARFAGAPTRVDARAALGLPADEKLVVYTGRLNGRKGLELALEAARLLPGVTFMLVGSSGEGPIEAAARALPNVRIVGWQSPAGVARHILAADILLIPPSLRPLAEHGSTVLPLKLYLYMAADRPIVAGDTPDVREMLQDGANAILCPPDRPEALARAITTLLADPALAARLAAAASAGSREHTWEARARRIADVLAARRAEAAVEPRPATHWGPRQTRRCLAGSRRWLAALLRDRTWVLPPAFARHRR